ncbi:MAG: ECF transporter S component [Oscillospiraceae bacterium]
MSHVKIRKLVLAALFAALCTVMTLVIQIPSPMQGYVNLGDCAVLLSAWVLGPVYGGVAAGTGSMLADLFSGYAHYAPGTFLIALCMAVAAALIFRFLRNRPASKLLLAQGASGLVAEAVMVAGDTSAIPACGWARVWLPPLIPGNVVQGALGLVTATAIYVLLNRSSALARI